VHDVRTDTSTGAPRILALPGDGGGLQARVADELRRLINSGEFAPGASLSETALAEAFGVSRTPIREALKQLQVEGLIEIVPRVGTFVSKPSLLDVIELFDVKEMLEGLAARLLAQRGRVPELARLKENVAESRASVARGDLTRYAELVHEFHEVLVAGADNAKLLAHYRILMNQLAYSRLVFASLRREGRPDQSVAEHMEVLERILVKDAHGAEVAMREHVRASHRELMAALRSRADETVEAVPAGAAH
jgi:DNA-binding GntR family transcriptional regulator